MPHNEQPQTRSRHPESGLNTITIIGGGTPYSAELTVSGTIHPTDSTPEHAIVTGKSTEFAVDTGLVQFQFSGEMVNVNSVNYGGVSPSDRSEPTIHVEYSGSS